MLTILFIITLVFFAAYAALIVFYSYSFAALKNEKWPEAEGKAKTLISILIPARNEENNIEACLTALVAQNYPKELYEILVINDHSEDRTAEITENFEGAIIKLINLKDHISNNAINSYKKKAIEVGVFLAKGELIVTTDADCIAPENWLKTIAAFYEQKKSDLIAMPVRIIPGKGFLSVFETLDFLTLQGITAAAVSTQHFNLGNGANLAYAKEAFVKAGGFSGIDALASGDDVLLMEKIKSSGGKISYLLNPNVIVETNGSVSWKAFINQRIRWASKSKVYSDLTMKVVLSIVYFFNLFCILSLGALLLFNPEIAKGHELAEGLWIMMIVAKMLLELVFLFPVAAFFRQKKLLWLFPLAQPFHIIYIVVGGLLGVFGKYSWKGRSVK